MSEHMKTRFDLLRDWLQLANSRAEAEVALRRFASAHGFDWFTYFAQSGAKAYGLSNYPLDWQRLPAERTRRSVDPVIEASTHNRSTYSWSEDEWPFRLTKQQKVPRRGESVRDQIRHLDPDLERIWSPRAVHLRIERFQGRSVSGLAPALGIDVRGVHRRIPAGAARLDQWMRVRPAR
jgi:hypothetical protein